ncbi:MAG: acetyltransferase [Chitinophaga sp.]|uniref:acetyltransferase n=1 Tax=Chitinophaga sp. TaxID=1869181 RepID=UPI001B2BBC77|nr:acetyltransferase [Chitinophaga sp.]MBO9731670.1 acetyltransferase [Chitinophaga sp.]
MTAGKKKICIIGAGGHGRETLCAVIDGMDSAQDIRDIACFMVDDEYYDETTIMGIEVIPSSKFDAALYDVVVAIGDPATRKKIVERLPADTTYATIIHPSAIISEWVEIGEGSIISAGVIITCNIKIGKHVHLNTRTTVSHDCILGDFFTAALGVSISGNCQLGSGVYLGTHAAIKQKITVTDNVTIGMGGVVVKDIQEAGVYVGVPVQKLVK